MTATVAIFGSSQTIRGSDAWAEAERAGYRCASAGLAVVTGGYGGTMEAASLGASRAGGSVIGVVAPALFRARSGANQYVSRVIEAGTLSERIGVLTELASGAIVLPGSIGTAAELLIAWNQNHIMRRNGGPRLPTVAVGEEWQAFWALVTGRLGAVGDDVEVVDNVDQAVDWLLAQPEVH